MSAESAPLQQSDMDISQAVGAGARCLICNSLQTPGAECAALVDPVGADCSVDTCLSAVLRPPLLSLLDRAAAVVCGVCFRLLQEIFSLDVRGRTLRRSVRANFAETCRGNATRRWQGAGDGESADSSATDVARRLEEAEAEDQLGVMSAGVVNSRCTKCDRREGNASTSGCAANMEGDEQARGEESVVQMQVIQMVSDMQ